MINGLLKEAKMRTVALVAAVFFAVFSFTSALAATPYFVDINSFGSYTSAGQASNSGVCTNEDGIQSFSWSHSLAYDIDYLSLFPQDLYIWYLDFYAGYSSLTPLALYITNAHLWAWDGTDSDTMALMDGKSFFTYDITVWLNRFFNFNYSSGDRTVLLDIPVYERSGGVPNEYCGFFSQMIWRD